jgi:hypothetical protein
MDSASVHRVLYELLLFWEILYGSEFASLPSSSLHESRTCQEFVIRAKSAPRWVEWIVIFLGAIRGL